MYVWWSLCLRSPSLCCGVCTRGCQGWYLRPRTALIVDSHFGSVYTSSQSVSLLSFLDLGCAFSPLFWVSWSSLRIRLSFLFLSACAEKVASERGFSFVDLSLGRENFSWEWKERIERSIEGMIDEEEEREKTAYQSIWQTETWWLIGSLSSSSYASFIIHLCTSRAFSTWVCRYTHRYIGYPTGLCISQKPCIYTYMYVYLCIRVCTCMNPYICLFVTYIHRDDENKRTLHVSFFLFHGMISFWWCSLQSRR